MRFCKRAAIFVGALVGDRRQELMQQIAVRAVQLDARRCRAARRASAASTKASRMRVKPARIERQRRRLALLVRHRRRRLPSASRLADCGINWPPSHGTWLEALRPAWASCIATAVFECLRTEARIGFSAASVASFHSPRQPGVMRPIASTAVASMQNIAAPDSASVVDVGEMPVIGLAVVGRILAHRRHHDAVGKRQAAQLDRGKQGAHAGIPGRRNGCSPMCSEARGWPRPSPAATLPCQFVPAAWIHAALAMVSRFTRSLSRPRQDGPRNPAPRTFRYSPTFPTRDRQFGSGCRASARHRLRPRTRP